MEVKIFGQRLISSIRIDEKSIAHSYNIDDLNIIVISVANIILTIAPKKLSSDEITKINKQLTNCMNTNRKIEDVKLEK